MRTDRLQTHVVSKIAKVAPSAWDALVGDNDPFVEHAFLNALEVSGSVGEDTGWEPCHVVVYDEDRLVGAVPLYLKTHSYGEYIFDWAWANASHQAGLPYYPKLVSSVPFTPVTGRRLLVADDVNESVVMDALLDGVEKVQQDMKASSVHVLFCTREEQERVGERNEYHPRLTFQYHWENQGWPSFDAYLSAFRRSARRNVLRERAQVADSGLTIAMLQGEEMEDDHWEALWRFYRDTIDRKGAYPYLTEAFFEQLRGPLRSRVRSAFAFLDGTPVAGTLGFQKGNALYGRYWGTSIDQPGLHFELCYYQHIEWCIRHGLQRFEAGAQGEHKIKRGLMPSPTYSVHRVANPALAAAVARYLVQERAHNAVDMEALGKYGPFKRHTPADDSGESVR